jgi:lipid-A-disaccharide synthase
VTNIMMVAGEASGDLHGAHLARQLKQLQPEVHLWGMGGTLMQDAGVSLLFNPTNSSALGFVEVLRNVRVLRRVQRNLIQQMEDHQPNVVVLIDFPGFNMRLAKAAAERNIPVVYYFSPSAWAWGRKRAKRVARSVKCICAVFPFEAEVYREAGACVCYVGHPLLDMVHSSASKEEFLPKIDLDATRPLFALLPGSRQQEIRLLLPSMLQAADLIAQQVPDAQFALPMAHTISQQLVDYYITSHPQLTLRVVPDHAHDIMACADAAIITSGTATLEAAILGTPMVMVYKLSSSTYRILKMLVKINMFALPNIVAGKKIVEELIQMDATPERMAAEVLSLWQQPNKRENMKANLMAVTKQLGSGGAAHRAAQAVLAVAHHEDPQQFALES